MATEIDRVFREFFRYSDDGKPNPPTGAPLPVGDPQSGVHNPTKREIREVLGPLEAAVDDASAFADAAQASAELAAGWASDIVSQGNVPIYATSVGVGSLEVPAGINGIRTNGYSAAGDGGGALYIRDSGPSPGSIEDDDGAHFKIVPLGDQFSVAQFGAVGNGSDQQDVLVAAVEAAATWKVPLYWPEGDYGSTSGLPLFGEVRHFGPGQITRGGETWPIDPGVSLVRNIYIAPGGSDTNDGLSPSAPLATIGAALDRVRELARANSGGRYFIWPAAGTYTPTTAYVPGNMPETMYPIAVCGPDVSGDEPTAIIDLDGVAGTGEWLRNNFNGVNHFTFRDLKFENASDHALLLWGRCTVVLDNVWSKDCGSCIQTREGYLRVMRGEHDGSTGICINMHSGTGVIGGGAGTSGSGNRVVFNGCSTGVMIGRHSNAYIVDCEFHGSLVSHVALDQMSRCRLQNNEFHALDPAALGHIRYQNNSVFASDANNPNTYPDGIEPGQPVLVPLGQAVADSFSTGTGANGFIGQVYPHIHWINGPRTFTNTTREVMHSLAPADPSLAPFRIPEHTLYNRLVEMVVEVEFQVAANTEFLLELAGSSGAGNAVASSVTYNNNSGNNLTGSAQLRVFGPRPDDDLVTGASKLFVANIAFQTAFTTAGNISNDYFATASDTMKVWRLYLTLTGGSASFVLRRMTSKLIY